MYERAFGFTEKPFSLLPDADFLFRGKKHTAALTMLEYGLMNRAGFTVITGEIGCGKTTLIRNLLDNLDEEFTVGLITNTHQSLGDLLQWVLLAFGLEFSGNEKIDRFRIFTDFVIEEYANNRCVVLIIDEAQNMDVSMLEELRMLWNINADKHLALQFILVGQPDLRAMLCRPELVQLAQRIAVDYHLGPLDPAETKAYILHRVRTAGGKLTIFRPECFDAIYRYTRGVPRLINLLCDSALVYAYGQNKKTVNAELIKEVLRDKLRGGIFAKSEPRPVLAYPNLASKLKKTEPPDDDNDRELLRELFPKMPDSK